jgi:hypothetical protein
VWGRAVEPICVKRKVLRTVKKEGNNLRTIKRMTANWIGLTWRRNCLLKDVTEDELQEKKSHSNLKVGELDGTHWRTPVEEAMNLSQDRIRDDDDDDDDDPSTERHTNLYRRRDAYGADRKETETDG